MLILISVVNALHTWRKRIIQSVLTGYLIFSLCGTGWAQDLTSRVQEIVPRLVTQDGHYSGVTSFAFSPRDGLLASGDSSGVIKFWHIPSGEIMNTLEAKSNPASIQCIVYALAFSPNGQRLASGDGEGNLKIWDTATGALLRSMSVRRANTLRASVFSVAFSPDGTLIASGRDELPDFREKARNSVQVWESGTGRLVQTMAGDADSMNSLAFSPNSKILAGGSRDHSITLWTVTTGQVTRTLKGHRDSVNAVAFSRDGESLVSGSDDKTVRLWSVATGKTLWQQDAGIPCAVAISHDGQLVATAPPDDQAYTETPGTPREAVHAVKLWDAHTGRPIETLFGGFASYPHGVAFSPDGQYLSSMDNTGIKAWVVDHGGWEGSWTFAGRNFGVNAVAVSPDGKTLASGSYDKLAFWDMITGEKTGALPINQSDFGNKVCSLAFSPDSTLLACGDAKSNVTLWNRATGDRTGVLHTNLPRILGLAFTPNGRCLATFSKDSTSQKPDVVELWEPITGQRLWSHNTSSAGDRTVSSLAFRPDGIQIVAGNEILDTETGNLVRTLAGPTLSFSTKPRIGPVAFSPDGKCIAGVEPMEIQNGPDGIVENKVIPSSTSHLGYGILIWSAATGSVLKALTGHPGDITCLGFSGIHTLVSGSLDRTLKVWDTEQGHEVATLAGQRGSVTSLAIWNNGKTVASASEDGSIKLWKLPTGQEEATLASYSRVNYSRDEWEVVTPDGRFDTDDLEDDHRDLHWVLPDDPFTPQPLGIFLRQYYEPRLLGRILAGGKLPPIPNIATLNRVQPLVNITAFHAHPDDPAIVDVTVEASGATGTFHQHGQDVVEQSGIYDLRLFRNGQLVGYLPQGDEGGKLTDLTNGTNGNVTHTFTVHLVHDSSKSVKFSAYAFNGDQVKSQTYSQTYVPTAPLTIVKGRAWVLAFGVNAYSDPHWNLHYAAADARALSQLVPRLQKTGQYSQVTSVLLVSDTGRPDLGTLPATKAALRAALLALAGEAPDAQSAPFTSALQKLGVTKAAPEDMVLLAFSCHGDTDAKTGEYYLFPADIGPDQSHGLTPDLEARSLSSAELTQWMQGVDAGEMAMVIDSCHSAAAAGQAFKPGPMDSPGLGQLAYYKRMRILSASAANAVAKEYPDLGHGLLTAALVQDGLVNGEARPAAGQTVLTVGPWLTFAEGDVPRLNARENGLKRPQEKHGLSGQPGHKGTEVVNGAVEAPDRGLQKPSLFDFHRAGTPDAAVSVGGGKAP